MYLPTKSRQAGKKVGKLKNNHVNIFILYFVLSLGLSFFEFILNWHMYFNVNTHKITSFLYSLCDEIQGQNIWVQFFNCTLVANWVVTRKKNSTFYVFIFNFINCTTQ